MAPVTDEMRPIVDDRLQIGALRQLQPEG